MCDVGGVGGIDDGIESMNEIDGLMVDPLSVVADVIDDWMKLHAKQLLLLDVRVYSQRLHRLHRRRCDRATIGHSIRLLRRLKILFDDIDVNSSFGSVECVFISCDVPRMKIPR